MDDKTPPPGWHIKFVYPPIPIRTMDWMFWHDDYDGAPDSGDSRCGSGSSFEDCVEQIREIEAEDICGLCGKPGADKIPHPIHWPGENVPDSELVHAECEDEECRRAHSLLTDKQREEFLRSV